MSHIKFIIVACFSFCSLYSYAKEFEVNGEERYVSNYDNRFGFDLGINPSLLHAQDVKKFQFSFAKKIEDQWLDLNVTYSSGALAKMGENNFTATNLDDTAFHQLNSTNYLAFGAGITLETEYAKNILPFKNIFETSTAAFTYNILKDNNLNSTFIGPGMMAKFALLNKFSNAISLGANFVYNLAVVKRSQNNDLETSSMRTLTLSHFTIGVDFNFYL
jgi:hypothetical protein